MKSIALSSTESEWNALSECAKEIKFVYQLLESMGIKVATPIIVRVDNVGAIFLSNNIAISQRTKHFDSRRKYVINQLVNEEKLLKIVFVKSQDNDADLLTKNLPGELFHKHASKLISVKGE